MVQRTSFHGQWIQKLIPKVQILIFFFFFDKNNITTNKKNHYTWACSTEKQQKKTRETKLVKPVKLGQFVKIQD